MAVNGGHFGDPQVYIFSEISLGLGSIQSLDLVVRSTSDSDIRIVLPLNVGSSAERGLTSLFKSKLSVTEVPSRVGVSERRRNSQRLLLLYATLPAELGGCLQIPHLGRKGSPPFTRSSESGVVHFILMTLRAAQVG